MPTRAWSFGRFLRRSEVSAMATMIQPPTAADLAITALDDFLRLIEAIKAEKHRDPIRALEDRLLEMRLALRA